MDANRFDVFVLTLNSAVPRRAAVVGALSTGLAALLTRFGVDIAESKKKKKKKCKGGKKKCGKKCRDLQTDPLNCGSCGNRCDDDMECRDGDCVCPEDETECGDTCCPSGQICVNGQCDDDPCPPEFICPPAQSCVNGECVCPDGESVCEEACCEAGLTCVNGQCEDLCPPALICPLGQACVDGDCTCPAAACAAAIDPTNDEFEECFCATTVEGEQVCFGNIACSPAPPACTNSADCGTGFACLENGCGGIDRCLQLCPLS